MCDPGGTVAPTVLVVDDAPEIRTLLRTYLEAEGMAVLTAGTGEEAVRLAGEQRPDVVLLDLGLPDLSGLDVLGRIRANSSVYVIVVTARAEEVDKIVSLSLGADDYIVKPFSPREVVARVHAMMRRPRGADEAPDETLRFPGLTLDPAAREITLDGEPVTLSALDFDLLLALARKPGRVFSRAQLLEQVWGYAFYGDERVVDVHVRTIRAALGDDGTVVIGTVRGVGYRFLKTPSGKP
nr:response regulator transcription factor [Tessaracoccus sp. MC1679]